MKKSVKFKLSEKKTTKGIVLFFSLSILTLILNNLFFENKIDFIILSGVFLLLSVLIIIAKYYNYYTITDTHLIYIMILGKQKTEIEKINLVIVKKWGSGGLLLEMKNKDYNEIKGLSSKDEQKILTILKEKNQKITIVQEHSKYGATPGFKG